MNSEDSRQTVMVVDDSPVNIQLLNQMLEDIYEVSFATNGADAIEMAARQLPDIILLDVIMPEMDGYELCRRLKTDKLLREIPVIFITALTQQEDEISGLQAGAVDYITKPFHPDIVKLRVKNQLELKMYRDTHAKQALLDGLTGIANRRAFDEQLQREWLRAERSQSQLSLVMIDVDYFKLYNDSCGHTEGDECLRQVATALLKSMRGSDFASRYGGEEFACILPETDANGALITAERIRSKVESLKIFHPASTISQYVTVSLGVVTIRPDLINEAADLTEMADRMLYQAKEGGRNRVCSLDRIIQ